MSTKTQPVLKHLAVPLEKSFKREGKALLVKGFFTSDNLDEGGDIITRAATERAVPKYRQWGNIRYMHLPRPVGTVARIGADDGLAWNEVEIRVVDPQAIFEVEEGLLKALSVGILIPSDAIQWLDTGGMLINDYLLAEISLVDHPANYDALLTNTLKALMSTYGLDAFSARTLKLLEEPMEPEITPVAVTEAIEPEVIEEPVAAIEDAPVAVEAAVDAEVPAEEVVPEPVVETIEQPEPEAPSIQSVLEQLTAQISALSAAFEKFVEASAPVVAVVAPEEEPVAQELGIVAEPVAAPAPGKHASLLPTDSAPVPETEKQVGGPAARLEKALSARFNRK